MYASVRYTAVTADGSNRSVVWYTVFYVHLAANTHAAFTEELLCDMFSRCTYSSCTSRSTSSACILKVMNIWHFEMLKPRSLWLLELFHPLQTTHFCQTRLALAINAGKSRFWWNIKILNIFVRLQMCCFFVCQMSFLDFLFPQVACVMQMQDLCFQVRARMEPRYAVPFLFFFYCLKLLQL